MMNLSEKLRGSCQGQHEQHEKAPTDWGPQQEEAIVALLLEQPDLFSKQIPYLQPALFETATANAVMAAIHTLWLSKGVIPPRYIVKDALAQALKVDDFGWEDILKLVDRPPDVREVPFILDNLTGFIRKRILAKLHCDEALSLMEDPILHANYVNGVLSELDKFIQGDRAEEYTAAELIAQFQPTPPVLDGYFREGAIANIVSSSKVGKSWLMYGLAYSVANGVQWFGCDTRQGKVLLVDNELQKGDLSFRLGRVAQSLHLSPSDLVVWPLRRTPQSLSEIKPRLMAIPQGTYSLIILDAKYRFVEDGSSENDNASETRFYNMLNEIAEQTGSAIVLVHHSTKGDQSEKKITDVGAGAGAQSRATDAHIVLRDHEDEGQVVLEAEVRSFAKPKPLVLRWEFPLWHLDTSADPTKLATTTSRQQKQRDQEGSCHILDHLREEGAATPSKLRVLGIGPDRLAKLLRQLVAAGIIMETPIKVRGNPTLEYQVKDYVVGTLSAEEINQQH